MDLCCVKVGWVLEALGSPLAAARQASDHASDQARASWRGAAFQSRPGFLQAAYDGGAKMERVTCTSSGAAAAGSRVMCRGLSALQQPHTACLLPPAPGPLAFWILCSGLWRCSQYLRCARSAARAACRQWGSAADGW